MPINKQTQAVIQMTAAQVKAVSMMDGPGCRGGLTIEETNLGATLAVRQIPSGRIHMVSPDGEVHVLGQPR